jgi:hypothetical protein
MTSLPTEFVHGFSLMQSIVSPEVKRTSGGTKTLSRLSRRVAVDIAQKVNELVEQSFRFVALILGIVIGFHN